MSGMAMLRRMTGFRWFERNRRGWEARFNWCEVTGSWGLGLGLRLGDEDSALHVHLGWPNIYFKLPAVRPLRQGRWGFSLFERSIHWDWGRKVEGSDDDRCGGIINLPWDWDHHRTSHLLDGEQRVGHFVADGTWRHETAAKQREVNVAGDEAWRAYHDECWAARDLRWSETHPYRHVLSKGSDRGEPAGAVQTVTATITVCEREWRQRWLRWTRFGRMVRRDIEVEFSDEVGSRAGSWKGGTVGCSYTMLPGEEPIDTLRRMERERSFDR